MLWALEGFFGIQKYLLRTVESYLSYREPIYDAVYEPRKKIKAGPAHSSILGLDLWNVLYDGILRLEMPTATFLVGYLSSSNSRTHATLRMQKGMLNK